MKMGNELVGKQGKYKKGSLSVWIRVKENYYSSI